MYGHKEDVCKKKDGPRKEWRVKQKVKELELRHTPGDTDVVDSQNAHGFTMVTKGAPAVISPHATTSPKISNSFQTLIEEGVEQGNHTHPILLPHSPHG